MTLGTLRYLYFVPFFAMCIKSDCANTYIHIIEYKRMKSDFNTLKQNTQKLNEHTNTYKLMCFQ